MEIRKYYKEEKKKRKEYKNKEKRTGRDIWRNSSGVGCRSIETKSEP